LEPRNGLVWWPGEFRSTLWSPRRQFVIQMLSEMLISASLV
jgi:hypothetical protein